MEKTDQQALVSRNGNPLVRIEALKKELESLREQLGRLQKLETVLENQGKKKRDGVMEQLRRMVRAEEELKSTARKMRDRRERMALRDQFRAIERDKKQLLTGMEEAEKAFRSLAAEVALLKRTRESLSQRLENLREVLDITDQVELGEKDLEVLYERVCRLRTPVLEQESALRQGLIDLIFKFHLPDVGKT